MAKEAVGEIIVLVWEGLPNAFFIKGHVSEAEAMIALNRGVLLYQHKRAILGPIIHNYARWTLESPLVLARRLYPEAPLSTEPWPDGNSLTLRSYQEPGRGRFPVTCFEVIEWRETTNDR